MKEFNNGFGPLQELLNHLNNLFQIGVVVAPPNNKVSPEVLALSVKKLSASFPRLTSLENPRESLQETVEALCSLHGFGCQILLPETVSIAGPNGQTKPYVDETSQTAYSQWQGLEGGTDKKWVFEFNQRRVEIPSQA